jgi:ParB-like chromosome segregation protein Spo0J
MHLVPINDIGDINFRSPRKEFTKDQMQEIADAIKKSVDSL